MRRSSSLSFNRGVIGLMLTAMAVGLGLGGCSSTDRMGRYNVVVSLSESMRDPVSRLYRSVEVDLVGVNAAEKSRWDGIDVDAYFAPDGLTRKSEQYSELMTFTNENPGPKTLSVSSAAWNGWLGPNPRQNNAGIGATQLYVLAKMAKPPSAAQSDPRLLVLPLSTTKWNNGQRIDIEITPDGLKLLSAPKVEKE
ncbi:MAG: hypothetical protein ACI89L_002488 [Phycisphaerales bacterium]|jgi:hypothetical protein